MQPFVAWVVLGTGWAVALQINAQHHPPSRQTTQPQHAPGAGKRRAIVAANGRRQTMPFKELLKTLPYRGSLRVGHDAQVQHVAAEFVAHCQGFAPAQILVIPVTFEVGGPDLIGLVCLPTTKEPASLAARAQSPCLHQASALQDSLEAALAGHRPSVHSLVERADLFRAPSPVGFFQTHDLTNHRFGQLARTALGSAGQILEPLQTTPQKAFAPFVARLGADPILSAQAAEAFLALDGS